MSVVMKTIISVFTVSMIMAIVCAWATCSFLEGKKSEDIAIRIAGVFMSLVLLAVIAFALALIWGW